MALMNLRYRDERSAAPSASGVDGAPLSAGQRAGFGAGSVLLRYCWARAGQAVTSGEAAADAWREAAWRAMRRVEGAYRALSLLNALVFLREGRFRSLLERLVGARAVYRHTNAPRAVSYEYLNRQLVWGELSELLLFMLPLFNTDAVKRGLRRLLPRPAAGVAAGTGRQSACGICGAAFPLPLPAVALPCGHVHCYFCLRASTQADPDFECPACGKRVSALARARPSDAAAGAGGAAALEKSKAQ